MKTHWMKALCAAALLTFGSAHYADAHGIFVANRTDQPTLVLGEGPVDNAYEPYMITYFQGYDRMGNPINVSLIKGEKNVAIKATENLGTTVTYFDYGYFTKDKDGVMYHKPMAEVQNAVKSTHAVKYNVNYWSATVKPVRIEGVPIQIVPSVNPLTLRKGDTYEIQVFKDGKPMANAPLINDVLNDLTNESQTDENGKATVVVTANGLNVVGVEIAYPTDTPGEQTKYFSSLSFIINPE